MGSDWGEAGGKDWGASEVHDWGVPGAPGSALRWDAEVAVGAEPRVTEPGVTETGGAGTGGTELGPTAPDIEAGEAGSGPSTGATGESIDSAVLAAMRTRRHSFSAAVSDDGPTVDRLGSGDGAVYVLDDGRDHVMIGRAVGEDGDGCIYCLVARITLDRFSELQGGGAASEAFSSSRDLSLSSVFVDDRASNVVLIQHYDALGDVPGEYRPPSPFLLFTDE